MRLIRREVGVPSDGSLSLGWKKGGSTLALHQQNQRGLYRLRKYAIKWLCNKSTALQAAEKLVRAVGQGFIPDITAMESMRALQAAEKTQSSGFVTRARL